MHCCHDRNELLKRVEDLVAAHTDIMKIEMRHAQDGDYKADLQVRSIAAKLDQSPWVPQQLPSAAAILSHACLAYMSLHCSPIHSHLLLHDQSRTALFFAMLIGGNTGAWGLEPITYNQSKTLTGKSAVPQQWSSPHHEPLDHQHTSVDTATEQLQQRSSAAANRTISLQSLSPSSTTSAKPVGRQ